MKTLVFEVRPRGRELLLGGRSDPARGGDKATARDAQGRLVLPASALRGALRYELERLRRGLGEEACGANRPRREEGEVCDCAVCRLFGSEGSATGSLRLEDAVLVGKETPAQLRPQVAVSRSTGSAVARHLAFAETGGVEIDDGDGAALFRARGHLVPLGPGDDGEETLRQLRAACAALSAIGGGKSRGLGWVACEVREAEADDETTKVAPSAVVESKRLRVTFEAAAPLHLGAGRPLGAFHRTLRHAPASTVRGALAFALLDGALATAEVPGFQDLFGEAATARFGGARLSGALPSATLRRCRPNYHLFDDLPAELLRREAARRGVGLALGDAALCPVDGCAADKVARHAGQPAAERLDLRVRTRSALNRRTATSMDAKLFSIEVIEPWLKGSGDDAREPVRFTATVDGLTREAAALLGRLDGGTAWLGGKRSQGYGACRVKVTAAEGEAPERIAARVERFDRRLREAWAALAGATGVESDLLDRDRVLLPVVLDEPWLAVDAADADALSAGPLDLLPRHRFLNSASVGAFGAIEAKRYGAPPAVKAGETPAVAGVAAGSVFVYELPRERLDEVADLLAAAAAAGDGRSLGRGRLRLWSDDLDSPGKGARR